MKMTSENWNADTWREVANKLVKHEDWCWKPGMVADVKNYNYGQVTTCDVKPTILLVIDEVSHINWERATVSPDMLERVTGVVPMLSHPAVWGWLIAFLISEGVTPDMNPWRDPIDMGDDGFGAQLAQQLLDAWGGDRGARIIERAVAAVEATVYRPDKAGLECPRCSGLLIAKAKGYIEQEYNFVGDESGELLEWVESKVVSIQCGVCHHEWDNHEDLRREMPKT